MAQLYFVNEKTGRKYRVVKHDKETNVVTLEGDSATWDEPFDKARFKRLGYVLRQEDDPAPATEDGGDE